MLYGFLSIDYCCFLYPFSCTFSFAPFLFLSFFLSSSLSLSLSLSLSPLFLSAKTDLRKRPQVKEKKQSMAELFLPPSVEVRLCECIEWFRTRDGLIQREKEREREREREESERFASPSVSQPSHFWLSLLCYPSNFDYGYGNFFAEVFFIRIKYHLF